MKFAVRRIDLFERDVRLRMPFRLASGPNRQQDDIAPVSVVPRPLPFHHSKLSTEVGCRTMG